ncbi:MAG: thiamine phosphate synthase [Marinifilaceae bacterium]
MKLIVITHPEILPNETLMLEALFDNGLQYLHLRKPQSSMQEIALLLNNIPTKFHPRIVLHQHYVLTQNYNLGGIHITGRTTNKELIGLSNQLRRSKSSHSLKEIGSEWRDYSYQFLSPIFNSISKSGYQSNFRIEDLQNFFLSHPEINNCVALGGLNQENINAIKHCGFGGFALLGSIWMNSPLTSEAVSSRFCEIQSSLID